jgi:hypothetical protein
MTQNNAQKPDRPSWLSLVVDSGQPGQVDGLISHIDGTYYVITDDASIFASEGTIVSASMSVGLQPAGPTVALTSFE